jgi:PatG C-terminal
VTEHTEGMDQPTTQHTEGTDSAAVQQNPGTAAAGHYPGAAARHFVYAMGTVDFRFPTLALEKEFAQATGRAEETAGQTDREAIHYVLSNEANRYLVRQLCFVMTIQGLETYILYPRDPADLNLLVEAVRTAPRPDTDVDVVIGMRGPIAPPEACNGLMVPIVVFDQLYSFDVDSLIEGVPRPESIPEDQEEQFRSTIEELFRRIMQLTDNAGATDEHRALNYLAVRYPAIYERTVQAYQDDYSVTEVAVRPSRLSGVRRIVDVIFSYTHRQTDVTEKYFVRVDVTEEFPFLVTKLSPYYDR